MWSMPAMNQDSRSSKFLFVNKSSLSSNLSRSSEAKERFTILSHVQNRRRKDPEQQKRRSEHQFPEHTLSSQAPSSSSENRKIAIGGKNHFQDSWVSKTGWTQQCLPRTYPTNNTTDPFDCTVAGVDAGDHRMLRYVFESISKVTLLSEAFALPSISLEARCARHSSMMDQRLERCVGDETLMYATLAYGLSTLAFSTGRIEGIKSPEYFVGKALHALRLRLSISGPDQSPDAWLLMSIAALAVIEFWSSIPEMWTRCPSRYLSILRSDRSNGLKAPRIHLSALNHSVEKAGGWTNIHPYVLESSILADKYIAIYNMTVPTIRASWDPGPMTEARQKDLGIDTNTVLIDLGRKLLDFRMCEDLLLILDDVVDFCKTAHYAWSFPQTLSSLDESWLFLRHQSLIYRLLSLDNILSRVEECIRITTIQFLLNATVYHDVYLPSHTSLRALTSALIDAQFWEKHFNDELLLWCLCTGAMSTVPSDEKNWFQAMLIHFFPRTWSLCTAEALCLVIEPFLFLPIKQEKQLNDFVKRLTAGGSPTHLERSLLDLESLSYRFERKT